VTRVVVLADSPLVRAGLEALLGDDPAVQVVRAAPVGAAAPADDGARPSPWEQTAELATDVVLWAPEGGPAVGARLAAELDDAPAGSFGDVPAAALPALVVVADLAAGDAVAVLRAGARAVLPTTADALAVGAAVAAAAAGLVALPARDAAVLLAAAGDRRERLAGERGRAAGGDGAPAARARGPMPGAAAPLSAREREVLALMAEGLANKQIAPRLGISEHTVKAHVAAVFAKLGAGTRAEAVVTAARRGLLML
jgi:DNA-binding NarL/FixJ family response regulator